jgi:alkylhydroperoxidase/carboxymuconolactone decarboxylase family protein YurZ
VVTVPSVSSAQKFGAAVSESPLLPGDLSYQDLIALTRAIADRRDTLGFGALIRGPLVGLTEEEIADAIAALPAPEDGHPPRLHLWPDRRAIAVYRPPA